jgi:hypothetical protein
MVSINKEIVRPDITIVPISSPYIIKTKRANPVK